MNSEAQWASQFSLSVSEEFNDNIFFSKQREHDFITNVTPAFTLLFQPTGMTSPLFKFDIRPSGQFFARNSWRNNFGENVGLNGRYTYAYSPRLNFDLIDDFQRRGNTRTSVGGEGSFVQSLSTPTGPPPSGASGPQRLSDFISNGETISNQFSLHGTYLFSPNITINGTYTTAFTSFIDAGGSDFSNTVGIRGVYKWQQEHNLNAGYSIGFLRSRNGENNVIHNFNFGDDFFSTRQIRLTPTLTLSGATGISFNAGRSGPRISNNSSVTLIKLWERASISGGARKHLTNSFGVSGISDTLTLFTSFNARLTEHLSATAVIDYSRYDTDDADFNTLQAAADLKYAITSWLCSSFRYSHRRRASDRGGGNTNLQTRENVYGNSVLLSISAHFDVWPNFGTSKAQSACGLSAPTLVPQIPQSTRQ